MFGVIKFPWLQDVVASAESKAKEKKPEVAKSPVSRRAFLRGALGVGISAVVEGCSSRMSDEYFDQNFDPHAYSPFAETEYPKRVESPVSGEQLEACCAELFAQDIGFHLPLRDIVSLPMTEGKITPALRGKKQDIIERLHRLGYSVQNLELDGSMFFMKVSLSQQPDHVIVCAITDVEVVIQEMDGIEMLTQVNIENREGVELCSVITKADPDAQCLQKNIFGDGTRLVIGATEAHYSYPHAEEVLLDGNEVFLDFLRTTTSEKCVRALLSSPLKRLPVSDIQSIEQLRECFRLTPNDPQAHGAFMQRALTYSKKDNEVKDEYRNPLDTLHSGWGDCDDYTVMNFFWAYLHHRSPYVIGIEHPDTSSGHVFVWYRNDEGEVVVLDNDRVSILDTGKTIEDYLADAWPKYEVAFNKQK